MKAITTFVLFVGLMPAVDGQVVLDWPTHDPVLQPFEQVVRCAPYPQQPAGANVFWDFSQLVSIDTTISYCEQYVTYTTNEIYFCSGCLDWSESLRRTAYCALNDGLYNHGGVYGYSYDTSLYYGCFNVREIAFPCSFQNTWSDSIDGLLVVNQANSPGFRVGTIVGEADAFGTVLLPDGSVSDVLRVNLHWSYTDSFQFDLKHYDVTEHRYYSLDNAAPIITQKVITVMHNGQQTMSDEIRWRHGLTTSLSPSDVIPAQLSISPNPSGGQIRVTSTLQAQLLELIDETGRIVFSSEEPGTNIELDLNGVPVGLYSIRLIGPGSVYATKRFVIAR